MPTVALPTEVSLYYEERGAGEPVLVIAGTGGDHSLWDATADVLAERYRVITFDNRGTGSSDQPRDPETYTMRVLADDAAALLDAIGIERAHVAGHSLGSTVAQELAINHPQKVASLQLHCTWGAPTPGSTGSSAAWRIRSSRTTWRRSPSRRSCGYSAPCT